MKIGVFDSGLGGLLITHSLTEALPQYDYIYLGDTARVPYGNRSQSTIYRFTLQAVDYLMKNNCQLVIIACNTASAEALRRLQQEYLPQAYPDRSIIGVLIPAAEAAITSTRSNQIGVLATHGTIASDAFDRELKKLRPEINITSQASPLLVPLIENDGVKWVGPILADYLEKLSGVDTLILGCTHYPHLKQQIREQIGESVSLISQDEIIPESLRRYLEIHSAACTKLSTNRSRRFLVTDLTDQAARFAVQLYGRSVDLELVDLPAVRDN